jgi:hypothetical protein
MPERKDNHKQAGEAAVCPVHYHAQPDEVGPTSRRAGVSQSALTNTTYGNKPALSKPNLTKMAAAALRSTRNRRVGFRVSLVLPRASKVRCSSYCHSCRTFCHTCQQCYVGVLQGTAGSVPKDSTWFGNQYLSAVPVKYPCVLYQIAQEHDTIFCHLLYPLYLQLTGLAPLYLQLTVACPTQPTTVSGVPHSMCHYKSKSRPHGLWLNSLYTSGAVGSGLTAHCKLFAADYSI